MAKLRNVEKEESETFSFRLPVSTAKKWKDKIAQSGLNKSAFFRAAVQENKTEVIAMPAASADQKRAIFLLQKASNNLNQLAHLANSQCLSGKLSEATFALISSQLQQLNQFMIEQAVVGTDK
jgi:Bacterial mobilisation protein (MobC)